MKELTMVVWITQLGLSVVVPLAGFPMAAVWACDRFGIGSWLIWLGVVVGICSAVEGFRSSLRAMLRLSKGKQDNHPTVSFNDHD